MVRHPRRSCLGTALASQRSLEPRAAVHGDLNAGNQLYRNGVLVGIMKTLEAIADDLSDTPTRS
jgi:hypothetical protein